MSNLKPALQPLSFNPIFLRLVTTFARFSSKRLVQRAFSQALKELSQFLDKPVALILEALSSQLFMPYKTKVFIKSTRKFEKHRLLSSSAQKTAAFQMIASNFKLAPRKAQRPLCERLKSLLAEILASKHPEAIQLKTLRQKARKIRRF